MGELKYIEVSMHPEHYLPGPNRIPISVCRIRIKLFGKDELVLNEAIPDHDFQSRFEWIMEKAKRVVLDNLK